MQPISNKAGFDSNSQIFSQNRNIGYDIKNDEKFLIKRANTVDIKLIFKFFDLQLNEFNRKIRCPLPSHKNDKTPSFFYYKDTNSFSCFGCKNGGFPVNFVSLVKEISKEEAAKLILSNFEADDNKISDGYVSFDKQKEILRFSDLIREFLITNKNDSNALIYAEKLTLVFDTINSKHSSNALGIKNIVDSLSIKLGQFINNGK